jgi:hypothetical protein
MRKISFHAFAFLLFAAFGLQAASAQLPKIPRIPKPNQPQPTPTQAPADETRPSTQPQPAAPGATAQAPAGGPAIIKTRVQFRSNTISSYKGDYNVWSWLPRVAFRTNGPLPSGAHYYVEVAQPGGAPWVKLDCDTDQNGEGFECGGPNDPADKAITAVGPVSFFIKMRNELAGADATLFTGKAKVEKVPSNEHGPAAAKKLVYYVNQDWNMPIGQVYIDNQNFLNIRFWVRGEGTRVDPHLFYQGKEVGRIFNDGIQVGAPGCDSDIEYQTSFSVAETVPQGAKWQRMNCSFPVIRATPVENNSELYALSANKGEYEVKVLRNNKLARSIKFAVGPDGKIVDNGIASASNVGGTGFIIVPVTILDNQDGQWDRTAWKTDAFYGNPLTGFTPAP